jgi:hypothetical protein
MRARGREARAAHLRDGVRRCAHAGGILSLMQLPKTVAASTSCTRRPSVHLRDDASDDGRRARELRQPRRHHRFRARRAPCVHGPACGAADDEGEAARGLRPGRVERTLRARRRDRPAAGAQAVSRQGVGPVE